MIRHEERAVHPDGCHSLGLPGEMLTWAARFRVIAPLFKVVLGDPG